VTQNVITVTAVLPLSPLPCHPLAPTLAVLRVQEAAEGGPSPLILQHVPLDSENMGFAGRGLGSLLSCLFHLYKSIDP